MMKPSGDHSLNLALPQAWASTREKMSTRVNLLLSLNASDDIFSAFAHGGLYFVLELLALLLERLLALVEGLHRFVHGVQLVQVAHCELVQTRLGLLLNQLSEVLFGIFALLDLSFQYFFQLLYFVKSKGVPFLLPLPLLMRLLCNLLLNVHIVVLEAAQSRLQQHGVLFCGLLGRWH